jgi:hypothetical protein
MSDVPGWYTGFIAEVVAHLPRDIDEAKAMGWIQDPQGLEDALRALLTGDGAPSGTAASQQISGAFQNDKAAMGWTLVDDVTEPTSISIDTIELQAIIEEGGPDLLGEEMVDYVEKITTPKLGQRHAEFLLDHPDQIPEEFQRLSLIFLGTVWRGPEGNHHVPCLSFYQGAWEITFGILEGGVETRDQMVVPKT